MKKVPFNIIVCLFILMGCSKPSLEPPIVTLFGPATVYVNLGDVYIDQGASATDKVDGEISGAVKHTGLVDMNKAGIYKIFYYAKNNRNIKSENISRTVIVRHTVKKMPGYYQTKNYLNSTGIARDSFDLVKINAGTDVLFEVLNFTGLDSVWVSISLGGTLRDSVIVSEQTVAHGNPTTSFVVSGKGKMDPFGKSFWIKSSKSWNGNIERDSLVYTKIQ